MSHEMKKVDEKNPHQNEGKKKKKNCFKTQTKETKKEFEKTTFKKLAS